jgi:Arc/MetJ-type ribon-helix-helix transcriptional regulator
MMKQISVSLDESDLQKLKEWFHSSSESEAVRSAITHILNRKTSIDLLELEGNVKWEGNLGEMREGSQ